MSFNMRPLLLLFLLYMPAHAATLPLTNAPYPYVLIDQDLRSVLRSFGANVGVSVSLSDAVQGQVRGKLPEMGEREFLDFLSKTFGLVWYYDGAVLYLYNSQEVRTEVLPLENISANTLQRILHDLGIADSRFAIKQSVYGNVMLVSGPERYLQLVRAALDQLPSDNAVQVISGVVPSWRPGSGGETIFSPGSSTLLSPSPSSAGLINGPIN